MLHGMQVAVPHERLVRVAARDARIADRWPSGEVVVDARELTSRDGEHTWTLVVEDAHGIELERWSEVTFRSLGERRTIPGLALRPWLERRLGELAPAIRIAAFDAAARAPELLPGIHYRPDHRPEVTGAATSTSTGAGLRIVVTGPDGVACDIAAVEPRTTERWRDLLGSHVEIAADLAQLAGESFDHAATRVWAARECAVKLGDPDPRLLAVSAADHAASLRAGPIEVITLVCEVPGQGWIAVAVATMVSPIAAGIYAAS
jgi:enediyne polyketide synthase